MKEGFINPPKEHTSYILHYIVDKAIKIYSI